ncbi:MBL fold metallo-hydrolase [Halomonas sp. PR-M31]|uniref:MBL fold metallo-hydrolase n=1 Tax=Halomonas sp. PR-M31 TaxID=1471202 RepID=UPI00069F139F|nr:MBL fold metallo-hydrolase [Halomonas sp. PR-M31]
MAVSQRERAQRKCREKEALSFPFSTPQASGQVVEVAKGVLWARMPMPMALNHVNVYLLRDDDGWWLIDTGLNSEQSQQAWELIAAQQIDGLPFKALVCTHFHHDHAGLAHWLMERFNLPLYMSYGEYFTMRALASDKAAPIQDDQKGFFARAGMPAPDIDHMFEKLRNYPFNPPCPQAFRRLRENDELSIGGRRWRVIVGGGHSPEHVCLYCAEDKLLIAGDQVLPEISSNVLVSDIQPEADPLKDWLASLDRLDALAPDTLVMPSHGEVFRQLPERLQQLREHHSRQFDLVMALAVRSPGFTAFEAMNCLFPQQLSAMEQLMALGEAIAHLNWLRREGRLIRRQRSDIDNFYPAGTTPTSA